MKLLLIVDTTSNFKEHPFLGHIELRINGKNKTLVTNALTTRAGFEYWDSGFVRRRPSSKFMSGKFYVLGSMSPEI